MKMRWLLTWKPCEESADGKKAKAMIILLGFLDPDLTEQTTHSPTMTRTTIQLILSIAAMLGMKLEKGDVTAAFLQGTKIERDLFAVPVEELAEALGIEPGQAARLTKEAYGLVAAPLCWFKKVCAVMQSIGFRRLVPDPCCWTLLTDERRRVR